MTKHRALLLCALLSASPACAIFDALGEDDASPRLDMAVMADMAADADMAVDQRPDLPPDVEMADADMPPDMLEDMPEDMRGDMEPPVGSFETFATCAASACQSSGGTCVLTQSAPARYACATPAQLSTCLGRRTLQGADASGPVALTLDGQGALHAFGAQGGTLHHYAQIEAKTGALAASHSDPVADEVLAIAAGPAPAMLAPDQLVIAYTGKNTAETSLGVYARRINRAQVDLIAAWPMPYETSTGATLSGQPCNDATRLTMRRAPPSADQTGQVLLTTCLRTADSGGVHVTLPLRVPVVMPARAPVWGVGYAATGYTVEDAGLDAIAGEQLRVRFLSQREGAIHVRGAFWQNSNFMQGERPMAPGGDVTPISGDSWSAALAAACVSGSLPSLDARHMILPSPVNSRRAIVFAKVAGGLRVIEWDDDVVRMSPMGLSILCGDANTTDAVWEDRVGIGELGWLAAGSDLAGEEAILMAGAWQLVEPSTQRLVAAAPLSIRALAASDRAAWAVGSLGAAVFVAELTRDGAPVCAP